MKASHHISIALILLSAPSRADLGAALEALASYQPGQPRLAIQNARQEALKGANDAATRAGHVQQLIRFIKSEAPLDVRREACRWLGVLATPAEKATLEELAKTGDLAAQAKDVLMAIENHQLPSTPFDHKLARLQASVAVAADPAPLLIEALGGPDPDLARLAASIASEGSGSPKVADWLVQHATDGDADRQLLALNTLDAMKDPRAAETAIRLAKQGHGAARTAAVARLGRTGDSSITELLDSLLAEPDAAVAGAARQAYLAMDETAVRGPIGAGLASPDSTTQATYIAIAAGRGAAFAESALWSIASQDGPNRLAAIEALGAVAAPDSLPRLFESYHTSRDEAAQKAWRAAIWDLMRRHPDPAAATAILREKSAAAPEGLALDYLAKRLEDLSSKVTLDQARHPIQTSPKAP